MNIEAIRRATSNQLMNAFLQQGGGIKRLAKKSELPEGIVKRALTHGTVDLADLCQLCEALGLRSLQVHGVALATESTQTEGEEEQHG